MLLLKKELLSKHFITCFSFEKSLREHFIQINGGEEPIRIVWFMDGIHLPREVKEFPYQEAEHENVTQHGHVG